jgi:hypothetical protein
MGDRLRKLRKLRSLRNGPSGEDDPCHGLGGYHESSHVAHDGRRIRASWAVRKLRN